MRYLRFQKEISLIILRCAGISLAATIVALLIVQLLWPYSRTRPFLAISDISLGGVTRSQLQQQLDLIEDSSKLELRLGDKVYNQKLADVGLIINKEDTYKRAMHYPMWQRIIPFSLFGNVVFKPQMTTILNNQSITTKATEWSMAAYTAPLDASLTVAGAKVAIVPAVDGVAYQADELEKVLKGLKFAQGTLKVKVAGKPVLAARNADALADIAKKAQSVIDAPLVLKILDADVAVPTDAKASWLTFKESQDKKDISFDIKTDVLQAYLANYQKQVYVSPGITTVTLVDGAEAARTQGAKGRELNLEKTISQIKSILQKPAAIPASPIVLQVSELQPKTVYNRTYSNPTSLQALLAQIAAEKGNYAITVRELDGQQRYASYNGTKSYHPASTYKLFVAYGVLRRIDAGALHWGDVFTGGKTVEQCFNAMIVLSDNLCAEAFGDKLGWAAINNEVHALGITGSTIIRGKMSSNTNDQVEFLRKLAVDNIVSLDSRARLLNAMQRQVYRSGVPAGVGGATVADKVGFLDGLLHDSGIVYSIHGTYIISIYTSGSSWSNIADSVRRIEDFLDN